MKRAIVALLLLVLIFSFAFSEIDNTTAYEGSIIPDPIDEEKLGLFAKTTSSEYTLTGIRFDLDDENMPVVIVKEKQKNISSRSMAFQAVCGFFHIKNRTATRTVLFSSYPRYLLLGITSLKALRPYWLAQIRLPPRVIYGV